MQVRVFGVAVVGIVCAGGLELEAATEVGLDELAHAVWHERLSAAVGQRGSPLVDHVSERHLHLCP